MQTAIKFNYQDYLQLSDDKRYEIIDGELFMVPSPNESHQRFLVTLTIILANCVKRINWVLFIARLLMYSSPKRILFSRILFLCPIKIKNYHKKQYSGRT